MNWGIIGFGVIAEDFTQSLLEVNEQTLKAIASRSNAEKLKPRFPEATVYDDYESFYKDPEIDIVYVATPHNFHYENVIKSLEHGKHVLCEKPMGISYAETSLMIEAARKNSRYLLEGMWTRYLPAYRTARSLYENGEIGEIELIRADFSVRREREEGHRMWNPKLAGGGLFDLGVYNVAIVNHYFGAHPKEIMVQSKISETGIDESIAAQLSYEDGKVAQVYSGMNTLTLWEATLYGTKGWIRIEEFFRTQQITTHIDGETKVQPVPFISTGFYHEIENTVERIKEGYLESDLFTHQDSLDSARIVEEILRLAKSQ